MTWEQATTKVDKVRVGIGTAVMETMTRNR